MGQGLDYPFMNGLFIREFEIGQDTLIKIIGVADHILIELPNLIADYFKLDQFLFLFSKFLVLVILVLCVVLLLEVFVFFFLRQILLLRCFGLIS